MFRVLVIHDESSPREELKSIIDWEDCGFTVCGEATNCEEAEILINQIFPHLIIVDMEILAKDDFELLKKINFELDTTAKLIALIGYNDFEYIETTMRHGIKNYIWKPVDEDELIETLNYIYYHIKP